MFSSYLLNIVFIFIWSYLFSAVLYFVEPPNMSVLAKTISRNAHQIAMRDVSEYEKSKDKIINIELLLNLKEKRVYVLDLNTGETIKSYVVTIGKKGWDTPVGIWQVKYKLVNPGWTNFKNRSIVKAPSRNGVLGSRWIAFWQQGDISNQFSNQPSNGAVKGVDEIGFHGTTNIDSLGKAASHGCVRMQMSDVEDLYRLVPVGAKVTIVKQ